MFYVSKTNLRKHRKINVQKLQGPQTCFLHTVGAKSLNLIGLGALGGALGSPWGALGALGEALGVLRGNLGGLEALLGSLWAALGRHRCTLTRVLRVKNVAGQKLEKMRNKSYKERNRSLG